MPAKPRIKVMRHTQKPPRFPSTARAVALCLRGGLLRRAVLERSRACLPLDAQRPRWGAFGALPVCRAQRTPITYDVSPATMLFKPALLSYRRNALAAPYACPVEDHCPAICFRVGRMHGQSAERRNEPNCSRPIRPAHSRCAGIANRSRIASKKPPPELKTATAFAERMTLSGRSGGS